MLSGNLESTECRHNVGCTCMCVKCETDTGIETNRQTCRQNVPAVYETVYWTYGGDRGSSAVGVEMKDWEVWPLLNFLLRHRKLPESCQEEEGTISSGSDSPELVSLSFTYWSQKTNKQKKEVYRHSRPFLCLHVCMIHHLLCSFAQRLFSAKSTK